MRPRRAVPVLMAVVALSAVVVGTPASASAWREKVAARVLVDTAGGRNAGFLVVLASQADVGPAGSLPTKLMVAPGEDVRTSWPPNTYAFESGTSMASPHVVGVIALLYSAKLNLIGNVSGTERLLERTALHHDSSECSSNGTYPKNLFGWGLADAGRAVRLTRGPPGTA